MKRRTKSNCTTTNPSVDLTGRRFGKWTVLKYAGQEIRYCPEQKKSSPRMWLCRCDCGLQKQVPHYNLTKGLSTQCQRCCHTKHGMSFAKIYRAWDRLKQRGKLPKEWQSFVAFRQAVGDPPDKKACLARYDRTKPYSSENVFWMYPAFLQDDPCFLKRLRKKLREERVAHDKILMRIRNAKSRDQRNRFMIAARKAGYSLELIGMAAKLTRQGAHFIVTTLCR